MSTGHRAPLEGDEFSKYLSDLYRRLAKASTNGRIIKGPRAELIWQFLRYNHAYRHGFDDLQRRLMLNNPELDLGTLEEEFSESWRISDPVSYEKDVLPNGVEFRCPNPVANLPARSGTDSSKWLEIARTILSWRESCYLNRQFLAAGGESVVILAVNPLSDRNLIQDTIEKVLDQKISELESKRAIRNTTFKGLKGNSTATPEALIGYIVCHRYRKLMQLSIREVDSIYIKILGGKKPRQNSLISAEIKKRLLLFRRISNDSPWTFFFPPVK